MNLVEALYKSGEDARYLRFVIHSQRYHPIPYESEIYDPYPYGWVISDEVVAKEARLHKIMKAMPNQILDCIYEDWIS